jgi:Rieske 2Fe-2S family protein
MTLTEDSPIPDPTIADHAGDTISESLIRTLPGRAYSSPEIFRKEQERIFEQMWFCAVRSTDLANPGDFKTVQLGSESLIISRNRSGSPGHFSMFAGTAGPDCATPKVVKVSARSSAPTTPGPMT